MHFHHQSHSGFFAGDRPWPLMSTRVVDSGRCSTFKIVLSLLLFFSHQLKKKIYVCMWPGEGRGGGGDIDVIY